MAKTEKNYKIEDINSIYKKIEGNVPWEKIKDKFDETYKEISKSVSIKGFRRGKVPRSLVSKMFKKHVEKDLSSELTRETVVEILKNEEEIKPASKPEDWEIEYESVEEGKPLDFSAKVEIIPEVQLENYSGYDLVKYVVPVDEEEINKEINKLQDQYSAAVTLDEGELKDGDLVSMDIMARIEGEPYTKNVEIAVGDEPADEDIIPYFVLEELNGKEISEMDDIEINHKFGDDGGIYSGKEVEIFVDINKVTSVKTPELDDDFAKDTGLADTFDELKEKISEKLKKRNENQSNTLLEKELLKNILAENEFEVGPALIKRQAEMKVNQTLMSMGMPYDQIGQYADTLVEKYQDQAAVDIKNNLILETVAKKENIEVTEEDFEAKYNELAEESEKNIDRIKADYQDEKNKENLEYYIKMQKTLDLLKNKSTIKEEEVDEFPEVQDQANEEETDTEKNDDIEETEETKE
ncbi:MAG: trigger factor [Myxococcota bacterium]